MKVCIVTFVFVLTCAVHRGATLDVKDYVSFIEEISQDEHFVEEYSKWSAELFSQPDYLYGKKNGKFPCPAPVDTTVPTLVHQLRPSDIKCVGAMGDSLTAGLGAHAITPIGLMLENRGASWSVGGDHSFSRLLSVPNVLRQYDKNIHGFSTKVSVIFLNGQNASHNHLNVAKSGDRSNHMPFQADLLMERMKNEELCNWNNDWKMITLFVGGNDLCSFCKEPNNTDHTPEGYLASIRTALDKFYNAPMPRTFINLVLVLDVRGVEELNSGGFICQLLHKRTCPCAAYPNPEERTILADYVARYQQSLIDLVNSNRYDGRSDFAVVYQPFMAKTELPRKKNGKIDFSYFAPDCFHFSGKGHASAAMSLWNNMLEPVGAKRWSWHINETLRCPTAEFPYIFTKQNSPAALNSFYKSQPVSLTNKKRETSHMTTERPAETTHEHHHHHKSKSQLTKWNFAVLVGLVFLLLIIVILSISRRQQIRVFINRKSQRLSGLVEPPYPDEGDDVDIWNRSFVKTASKSDQLLTKTHGTRINFEPLN